MSEDAQVPSVPDNHTSQTGLHSFKILVQEGYAFYVNPHFLAEFSPVFEKLFFGNFKEAHERKAEFPDETIESMSLLLNTLETGLKDDTTIATSNLNDLMRLANKYEIAILHNQCKGYIARHVVDEFSYDAELMSDFLQMILEHGNTDYEELKWEIIGNLATVKTETLVEIKLWDKVNNSDLTAAIFNAAMKNCDPRNTVHSSGIRSASAGKCTVPDCGQENVWMCCSKCRKFVCSSHLTPPQCYKTVAKEKVDRTKFESA